MGRDSESKWWIGITGAAAAGAAGWWLLRQRSRRRIKPLPALPERSLSTQMDEMAAENSRLRQQVVELQEQASKSEPPHKASLAETWTSIRKNPKRIGKFALGILCAVLSVLPIYLVVNDRIFGIKTLNDAFQASWCQSEFLCRTRLPSYFMLILPALILVLALFIGLAREDQELAAAEPAKLREIRGAAGRQRRVAAWLGYAALAAFGIDAVLCLSRSQPPGFELLGIVLIYWISRCLDDLSWPEVKEWGARTAKWLTPLGVGIIGLVVIFFGLYSDRRLLPLAVLVGVICAGLVYKRRADLPAAGWVTLAAMAVLPIAVNAWNFSTVGDEYSFYTFGIEILEHQSFDWANTSLFTSRGVYGSHPYLSSVIQAFSMLLLGRDNFGWRMSSIMLAVFSTGLFTLFMEKFVSRRIALVSGLLLAFSHYLMAFGKIGYNNLQALFALALVLWVTSAALEKKRAFLYTGLGLSLGFCLYVYPAALYAIPIPFLALLFFDPPWLKKGLGHWAAVLGGFFLLLFPLLMQPDYWLAKIPGTVFFRPELVAGEGLGFHFFSNLLYSSLSYLYIPNETHFVFVSYLDPISAVLVLVGLGWLIKLSWREKFPRFWLLSGLAMLIMVGATHDRTTPTTTRMFMLLLWWVSLAAAGLTWLVGQLRRCLKSPAVARGVATVILVSIAVLNLWLAYGYSPQKEAEQANLEVLFLRLLQREADKGTGGRLTWFFLTEPDWGIDGIRTLQDVYGVPGSQAQLGREAMTTGEFSPSLSVLIQPVKTLVIIQPWMGEEKKAELEKQLAGMNKVACEIRGDARADVRFKVWADPGSGWSCPAGGVWD